MAKRRIEYLNEEVREHSLRPNKFWKVDIIKPMEEESEVAGLIDSPNKHSRK